MARSRSSQAAGPVARSPQSDRPDTNRPTTIRRWWGEAPEGCGRAYVDKVHEHDPATPEDAHLYGSAEPRICTPPLRELTEETSLGFDVIDFAYDVLGIILHPWQRAALIRMLELLEDGSLRFETVVILVARQNGKSTLAQVLTIYVLVAWGWPLVLGTAQDLDVAEQLWQEVVDLLEDDEELSDLIAKVVKVNGKKELKLTNEVSYKVKAANRRAGRGLSGNLILLDELREHQNWDAYGAITKTTMARGGASLILALSNAGDILSRVLRYLRLIAHRALGDPDGIVAAADGDVDAPTEADLEAQEYSDDDTDLELDEFDSDDLEDLELEDLEQEADSLCLLEWSAPPGCKRNDRRGWSLANPSRRYQITDRKIAASLKDPEWVFRTEVLCQWNDGATNGPFAPGSWEATKVPTKLDPNTGRQVIANRDVDRIDGKVYAGIAQTNNRGTTYIALAGWRPDGLPQVEIVAGRAAGGWEDEWLSSPDRKGRIRAVGGQTKGAPEATLLRSLQTEKTFRMPVIEIVGGDMIDANADAEELLRKRKVWHTAWPILDLAAQTAEWKVLAGGQRIIDSKNSPIDPAALRAWMSALWMLQHPPKETPPPPPPGRVVKTDTGRQPRNPTGGVNFASVNF